jgi:hypothetical protein
MPNRLLTEPITKTDCADPVVIKMMQRLGIPIERVEFCQEYNARKHGGSPYSKGYKFTDGIINKEQYILVASGLPMCDADSYSLDPGWELDGGMFVPLHNLFDAGVIGDYVEIEVLNNQPDGRKKGDRLRFQPQLFLDDVECKPKSITPELIDDPLNPNYRQNVLRWDYEWCWRYMRIIEGRMLNWWELKENPGKTIRIDYNQTGDFLLRLGRFAVSPDREVITPDQLEKLIVIDGWPVKIGDSSTFYPDADIETTSVDGIVADASVEYGESWATKRSRNGDYFEDLTNHIRVYFRNASSNTWSQLWRGIMLFDTSELDDGITITDATLSMYFSSKRNELNLSNLAYNIYSSLPNSNTALHPADFTTLGTTDFSTAIAYEDFSAAFNAWPLNSTGIAAIVKDGVSKFGFREKYYDADANVPISPDAINTTEVVFYSADQGEGYKPKLVVTWGSVKPRNQAILIN